MPKRFSLTIAGRTFATRDELHEAIKEVLHARPPDEDLTEDYPFLRELINQHPDAKHKIGIGIRAFQIQHVYGSRCFRLFRVDGSSTDFSYLKCVRKFNKWSHVQKAFRLAVFDQVIVFRRAQFNDAFTIPCAVTGKMVTEAECDVDHASPFTFIVLLREFLKMKSLMPEDIKIAKSGDNQIGRRLADEKLQAEWQAYHLKHAILRIVESTKHREQSVEGRKGVKGAAPKCTAP